MTDEEDLIERAKDGDVTAFEKLIYNHQTKIYNFALSLCKDDETAKDITQSAFLKAFLSIKEFKGKSSFSTWLYRIIYNTFQDELRKSYRKFETPLDYEKDLSFKPPDEDIDRSNLKDAILKSIKKLPPDLSTIIVLRDVQGFSYEEIANIMRIRLGTVKSRIARARKCLREILKDFL